MLNSKLLKEILWIFADNNLLNTTIIHTIFGYNDPVYHRSADVLDCIVDIYDKLEIPINICDSGGFDTVRYILSHNTSISSLIKILRLYESRGLPVDNDTFMCFINQHIKQPGLTEINELIDICTKLNLNMSGKWVCYNLSLITDWKVIQPFISAHIAQNIDINTDNQLLISACKRHGHDAVKFMLEYCGNDVAKGVDEDSLSFTDVVIAYGSIETIRYVLQQGIQIRDNIICMPYHEYRKGKCNYRRITTEYMCYSRFSVGLADILSAGAEARRE
jgi:hypothetical protein